MEGTIVQLIIIVVVAAGLVSLLIKSVYDTIESRKRYTCGACGYKGLRNYEICPHCQNLERYS
jgi:lipopolysaccharide biosynthesis regulator YciM